MTPEKQNGEILRLTGTFSETIVHSRSKLTSTVHVARSCKLKKVNSCRL